MRADQLDRFLDAQSEDTVALWIVVQLLVRRLGGCRPEDGSDDEHTAMLRTIVAASTTLARTDVWN